MEEFKSINNLPGYFINKLGVLKGPRGIRKNCVNDKGYLYAKIRGKTYFIHRLVALTFIPNLENKPTVNHIDYNVKNNHYKNLEWATIQEQNIHKRPIAPEKRRLISSRKVIRCDLEGNEIETYETIRDAAKWVYDKNLTTVKDFNNGNNIKTKISAVASGKRKTTFGFKWKYTDELLKDEEWKDIGEGYKVSNKGRFMNRTGRITTGYYTGGILTVNKQNKQLNLNKLIKENFLE